MFYLHNNNSIIEWCIKNRKYYFIVYFKYLCFILGSLKYVHQSCLQQWLTASETRSCELCKFNFIMHTKIKPFSEVHVINLLPKYNYSSFLCFIRTKNFMIRLDIDLLI